MGNDANGIVACVKLKFFHLEGGGLNHQRDYQRDYQKWGYPLNIHPIPKEEIQCKTRRANEDWYIDVL
jgi:hypothetical protein